MFRHSLKQSHSKNVTNKQLIKQRQQRTTTAQLYPGRDRLEFEQGHVTKNQPITVLVLLSERLHI